jgi:hypothetical protein
LRLVTLNSFDPKLFWAIPLMFFKCKRKMQRLTQFWFVLNSGPAFYFFGVWIHLFLRAKTNFLNEAQRGWVRNLLRGKRLVLTGIWMTRMSKRKVQRKWRHLSRRLTFRNLLQTFRWENLMQPWNICARPITLWTVEDLSPMLYYHHFLYFTTQASINVSIFSVVSTQIGGVDS